MNKGLYRKLDRTMTAWDLTAGCQRYVNQNKQRRQLRKRIRRAARKLYNNIDM